jgi:hypothetical protein
MSNLIGRKHFGFTPGSHVLFCIALHNSPVSEVRRCRVAVIDIFLRQYPTYFYRSGNILGAASSTYWKRWQMLVRDGPASGYLGVSRIDGTGTGYLDDTVLSPTLYVPKYSESQTSIR